MTFPKKVGRTLLGFIALAGAAAIVSLLLGHWEQVAGFLIRFGPVGIAVATVGGAVAALFGVKHADPRVRIAQTQAEIEAKGQKAYDDTKDKLDAMPAADVVDGLPNAGAVHAAVDAGADRLSDRSSEVVSRLGRAGRAAPGDRDQQGGAPPHGG